MRLLLLRVLRKTLRILTLGTVAGYLIACLFLYLNQEQMLFHPTVLAHDFVYPFTHHSTEVFLPVDGATILGLTTDALKRGRRRWRDRAD
jgi:hypothetical protein